MKQEHGIVILIGLAAAGLLYYFWRESRNAVPAAAPPPSNEAATSQSYPGGTPLPPSQFVVGGSPLNLTYNTFPPSYSATGSEVAPLDSFCGNGGCDGCGENCDSCCQTQQPVTFQMISSQAMKTATDNFSAFVAKLPPATPQPIIAGAVKLAA